MKSTKKTIDNRKQYHNENTSFKSNIEFKIKKFSRKRSKKIIIIRMILLLIIIGIAAVLLFAKQIFGPDHPISQKVTVMDSIINFFKNESSKLIDILFYILLTYIISKIIRLILSLIQRGMTRGLAVMNLINSAIKYLTGAIILIIILSGLGVDTTALLTSIGILGLILGLGAQSLIEDIISGVFIVFEKTFDVGDVVVFDGFRGTIIEIGLRTTKLADAGGDILIVNNSDIRKIVNMTDELSTAICDFSIEYSESIPKIEKLICDNCKTFKENIPGIVDGPIYLGVNELGDSAVILRMVAKCNETDRYQVIRDLNREIKILFDKNNINIPFPQIVVTQAKPKAKKNSK